MAVRHHLATGYDAETARQALRDVFDEAISTAPPEVAPLRNLPEVVEAHLIQHYA